MKNTKVICPVCGSEIAISEKEYTVKNAVVIGKDSNLGVVELPIAKKGKADERLAALKAAGVDTSNLFAMRGASGEGMVVRIKNGVPEVVADDDPIFKLIVSGGTIPERRLFRRWVMAQMFQLLSKRRFPGGMPMPINDAIRRKGYEYQWKMTLEEMRVQDVLCCKDVENFIQRNRWFNKSICLCLAHDYIAELRVFINNLPVHKCKGVPYKRINGRNIFISDIETKVLNPIMKAYEQLNKAITVTQVYQALKNLDDVRIKLDWRTPFCKEWIDAFKGAGAYYTMKNLIMFHGCNIFSDTTGEEHTKDTSIRLLEERANMYAEEGWRMFAMMKKLIIDNNIDIEAKRKEWRIAKRAR